MSVGLSRWQTIRQVAYRVASRRWSEGALERVINADNVVATAGMVEDVYGTLRPGPFAILKPGATSGDPENPELLTMETRLSLGVITSGDKTGQGQLIGLVRSPETVGSSEGRGVLEIEEEILGELGRGDAAIGLNVQLAWASAAAAGVLDGRNATVVEYGLRCLCTRSRGYHPPQGLTATAAGGGAVSLAWRLPPDRYDRSAMKVRRAAGSTAPATVADGSEVVVTSLAVAVTDTPGAGTWSYAAFMAYNEQRGSALRYSSQETGTTRTVVAT